MKHGTPAWVLDNKAPTAGQRFDDQFLYDPIPPHDPDHVALVTAMCRARGAEDVLEYLFGREVPA